MFDVVFKEVYTVKATTDKYVFRKAGELTTTDELFSIRIQKMFA